MLGWSEHLPLSLGLLLGLHLALPLLDRFLLSSLFELLLPWCGLDLASNSTVDRRMVGAEQDVQYFRVS